MGEPECGMSFRIGEATLSPKHRSFRPPTWPPPKDWIVSENSRGEPLSRWEDDLWDFSALAGKSFTLFFASTRNGSKTQVIDEKNKRLLRLFITSWIWGPNGPRSWNHLRSKFNLIRKIFVHCEFRGILASDLVRHPDVISEIPTLIPTQAARSSVLMILDRMSSRHSELGFSLLDSYGVAMLARGFRARVDKETEQTAYIPPRIWLYQLGRLRECLDDFLMHEENVAACYNFCIDAYATAFGTLNNAIIMTGKRKGTPPFSQKIFRGSHRFGQFQEVAEHYGIRALLQRWAGRPTSNINISSFQLYLNLISNVALAYIANFTLQRKEELSTLRADCLIWEEVPVIGKCPIIRGETTKTDPDSDARWPTSPSVETAVNAASAVARLRLTCACASPWANCSDEDISNPKLLPRGYEPWAQPTKFPYSFRVALSSYSVFRKRFPRLFDDSTIKIAEKDLITARQFTPNLNRNGAFSVGQTWPFGLHQLRRTGAINMFASGLLSDSSIQVLMKHLTRFQASYYGRNFSKLNFNAEFEGACLAAKYEVLARQIEDLVDERYFSPLGASRKSEQIINLVSSTDFSRLVKAGEAGEISFRRTRLGGCTKIGYCEYGGVEATSRCAGGDGGSPCREALFDATKRESVERQLADVEAHVQCADIDSPRYQALLSEARGLRNYLNAVDRIR